MAEASQFKFGTQLGFAKPHHEITPIGKSGHGLGLRELPKILRFHFNIYTMAETRDFKFGIQLGLAKVHRKITPREKMWVWSWARKASKYLGFSFNISATAALSS